MISTVGVIHLQSNRLIRFNPISVMFFKNSVLLKFGCENMLLNKIIVVIIHNDMITGLKLLR